MNNIWWKDCYQVVKDLEKVKMQILQYDRVLLLAYTYFRTSYYSFSLLILSKALA